MKIVKEAVYASIFGAGLCLASCGKNTNQNEATAPIEDTVSTTERDGIETEMDSVVSPDTVMPAP